MPICKFLTSISVLAFILATSFNVVLCGKTDSVKSTRIVGGREARPNEVPYIVSLQRDDSGEGRNLKHHSCGGSILNEKFVITAAHCIKPVSEMSVLAGTTDHTLTDSAQLIKVKAAIVHSGYHGRSGEKKDDIALLELAEPLTFNEGVQPIPIPPTGTLSSGRAVQSGWGATELYMMGGHMGSPSNKLMTIDDLSVVPKDACDKMFREIPKNQIFDPKHKYEPGESEIGMEVPTKSILCAGNVVEGVAIGVKSSCEGDSGGPLQCKGTIDGKVLKYLCGVVSYGWGCGTKLPTAYTEVAQYHDWILQNSAGGPPANATRRN